MTLNLGKRFAVLNGIFVLVLASIVVLFALLPLQHGGLEPKLTANLAHMPLLLLFTVIGGLIVSTKTNHSIGVGLCLIAAGGGVLSVTESYVEYDLYVRPGALLLVDVAAWTGSWSWVPVLMPPITLLLLVSPDGKLPSPKWRPALMFDCAALLLLASTQAVMPGPLEEFPSITNPFGVQTIKPIIEILQMVAYILLLPAIGISVAAMVVRFRRSHGIERQQLKWFAMAATGALALFMASWVIGYAPGFDVWLYTPIIAMCLFPLAIGIAILRHNLYDIDRIINRALVYTVLTAGLGAIYIGLVVLLQALLRPVSGGSDLAIVATTLIVAALFLPARRYIQRAVDRRFNRRTYDAALTIDAFSARLREQIDLDTLRYELLAVADETMQPSSASIWLREVPR